MNKKILTASAFLAAASMSFGFETWIGDSMVYQVNTELDAGGEKSGYWFNYGDDADGGASTVTWPVPKGTEWQINYFYTEIFVILQLKCKKNLFKTF